MCTGRLYRREYYVSCLKSSVPMPTYFGECYHDESVVSSDILSSIVHFATRATTCNYCKDNLPRVKSSGLFPTICYTRFLQMLLEFLNFVFFSIEYKVAIKCLDLINC